MDIVEKVIIIKNQQKKASGKGITLYMQCDPYALIWKYRVKAEADGFKYAADAKSFRSYEKAKEYFDWLCKKHGIKGD